MTIITLPYQQPKHPHLRRFDLRIDLAPVADLIELCFTETLDDEGRRYIRQMRSSARYSGMLHLAAMNPLRDTAPYSGFVWEEDDRIVGNLSQFSMPSRGKKVYLIANVAVHPDYRQRGIARAMTEAALEHSRDQRVDSTWLHVRDDNSQAIEFYRSMGFVERTRRTTWMAKSLDGPPPSLVGPVVGPRRREHWPQQAYWFEQIHPPEIDWYLPFKRNTLRPGVIGFILRMIEDTRIKQWAVTWQGQLLGVLVWQQARGASDKLWLAAAPEFEEKAISALISNARWEITTRRKLSLEYPAGRAEATFSQLGFSHVQTLIWMEYQA
jgi:GNAT superfamily N-acetyltransferase